MVVFLVAIVKGKWDGVVGLFLFAYTQFEMHFLLNVDDSHLSI